MGLSGGSRAPINSCLKPKLSDFVLHKQENSKLNSSSESWQRHHNLPCYKYILKAFCFHFFVFSTVNFVFGLLAPKPKPWNTYSNYLKLKIRYQRIRSGPDPTVYIGAMRYRFSKLPQKCSDIGSKSIRILRFLVSARPIRTTLLDPNRIGSALV